MLYLFDEPLSNLDARLRIEMRTELKRLHQSTGATIVYVTHDQIEALTLSTKVVVIRGGVIQQQGAPQEIYSRPANIFVADFMGSMSMNLFDAEIGDVGGKTVVTLTIDGRGCKLPVTDRDATALAGFGSANVTVGLRPEDFSDTPDRYAQVQGQVLCKVELLEPLGSETIAFFNINGKSVAAKLRADTKVKVGDPIELTANMEKASFFAPSSGERIA